MEVVFVVAVLVVFVVVTGGPVTVDEVVGLVAVVVEDEVVEVVLVLPLFKFRAAYPPTAIMIMIITTTATMADLPIACFNLERLVESIKQADLALILKALLPF